MEEIEVPLETVQENAHHVQHAGHGEGESKGWLGWAALASAIIAVCAAVSALLAGQHANEAMIDQIKSSNDWNYYQAKGVKAGVLQSKVELLKQLGRGDSESDADLKKLEEYKKQQEEISEQAKEHQDGSEHHLRTHEFFARSVTMFQVAIALGAVSILSRKRRFFFGSLGLAVLGLFFAIQGFLS